MTIEKFREHLNLGFDLPNYRSILRPGQLYLETDLAAPRALSGVYFFCTWRIEYIGSTVNLFNRISVTHEHYLLGDMVFCIPVPFEDRTFWEAYLIHVLKPIRNGRTNQKRFQKTAPWGRQQVLEALPVVCKMQRIGMMQNICKIKESLPPSPKMLAWLEEFRANGYRETVSH